MGKLLHSIRTILTGAATAKTLRVMSKRGQHAVISFWSGRAWISRIAFSAFIVATINFVWPHWQASTKVGPPQGVWATLDNSKYLLRLSGSKTTGSVLAPELVRAWLVSIRASDVEETDRVGRDRNQIFESVISARLNGNPIAVELQARGAASAFKDMATGDADIGITSREINSSELIRLMPLGDMRSAASEHVLGLERVAVIVPQSNTISALSRSTLKKIFNGQITNWSAVGMKRLPIHLYVRDKNSRTNDAFASLILGDDSMANTKRYEDSAKLESDVASDPGGIGFVSMPYVKGTRSVFISDERAAPLGRQLYLYTAATPRNPAAIDFVRFALSRRGQNIVRQARFVPELGEVSLSSDNPATIASLGDNLKVSISDVRVEQSLPAPPAPPKLTQPSVAAVVPELTHDPVKAPSRSPTITASLQAPPPPPAIIASLQAPALPGPQATPPVARTAPLLPPGPEAASPVMEAAPSPPAPEHPALPPVVNVAPPAALLAPPPSTPPVAISSHAVTATDYPRAAVQLQEQGTIAIKYLVKEDGSVADCTVTTSTGKPLLDAAACAIVKRRWKFKPATRDGKPVAEFLTADVVFKLADPPKEPRPTIMASLSPPPAPTAPVVTVTPDPRLPIALTNHGVTIDDYPLPSRYLQEQGNVVLKYLVKQDGSVGDCTVTTSSGKPRLDAAACAIVKRRWKFEPAMQDGKPVAEFLTAEVVFKLK